MRILLLVLLLPSLARPAGIGLLTAHGSFRLNSFRVWDNATVTENALVETWLCGARITLDSGQEILLGPRSRARISHDAFVLESGAAIVKRPGSLAIRASPLTRDSSGAVLAGPRAAAVSRTMDTFTEAPPLSQRP